MTAGCPRKGYFGFQFNGGDFDVAYIFLAVNGDTDPVEYYCGVHTRATDQALIKYLPSNCVFDVISYIN